jgi:hypothetical protein
VRTAAYIGKLTRAGVDPKVAQAHGEALEEALTESYVTRDYLDRRLGEVEATITAVGGRLEAKIAAVEAKIDTKIAGVEGKIAELEAKMLRYMIGQTAAIGAIVFGLLRLLK